MATRNFYDVMTESEIMNLKINDVFYESGYGIKLEFVVCEEPTVQNDGEFSQIVWKAVSSTGEIVPYMVTKGASHYGPIIHRKYTLVI